MATKNERSGAKPKTAEKPPFMDDATLKETYADDFVGMFGIGPNFHLTFAARRPAGPKGALVRHATARIVLPIDAMLDLYNSLGAAVGHLEKGGVIKLRGKGEPATKAEG
jgi:hypothetical protein